MTTRRKLLYGIGGGMAGITSATLLTTEPSKAASVDANFNVSNTNTDVSSPVQRVDLIATGNFEYETSVVPDSVILRLEAKRGTNFQQLAAMKIDSNLTETYTDSFELVGNLLDLELVTHDDVNPVDIGESKELTLDARINMSVKRDNRTIHEDSESDSFTAQINKTTATVTSAINATGDLNVVTE